MTKNTMQRAGTTLAGLTLLTLASGLVGCGEERPNDDPTLTEGSLNLAIEQAIDNTVIAAVDTFAERTTAFNAEVASFCANPDASGLAAAQASWKQLHNAWGQLLPFNFGPLNDDLVFPMYIYIDSYRLRGTNYSETVRASISGWLAADDTLNYSYFASLNFQYLGLLPLELALFERSSDQSQTSTDVLAEFVAAPRKCDMLAGLGTVLQEHVDYVQNGWHTSYLDSGTPYRTLILNGELDDGSSALVTLITSVQEYLDYLNQRSTVSAVAKVSGNNWSYATASIDVIGSLLAGTDATSVSFFDLMTASGNSGSVTTVESNLALARDAIDDLDVTTFNSAAATLDGNFKREIPDSLDVSLGINFTDGD